MLIAYEPNSDVLTVTIGTAPVASQQVQGSATVHLDAGGAPVAVSIPEASTQLWEHGGQIAVTLPQTRVVSQIVEEAPPAV